jgi:hypothetical protein
MVVAVAVEARSGARLYEDACGDLRRLLVNGTVSEEDHRWQGAIEEGAQAAFARRTSSCHWRLIKHLV